MGYVKWFVKNPSV